MGISSKLEKLLSEAKSDQPLLVRIRWRMSAQYIDALNRLDATVVQSPAPINETLNMTQEEGMRDLTAYLDSERIVYAPSKHFFRALVASAMPEQIRSIAARPEVESIATQQAVDKSAYAVKPN